MIKFEFESLEELQSVLEAVPLWHKSRTEFRESVGLEPPKLAETFVWVYEKTGE